MLVYKCTPSTSECAMLSPTHLQVAPMSTTTSLTIAAEYGKSANSLLFKIKVVNALQHGADLKWLSAFPAEGEVCFPPLTYLQPTGNTQKVRMGENCFTVVEVVPHIA